MYGYMLSVMLHLILALLTTIGAFGVFLYWRKEDFSKHSPRRNIMIFFIFFTFYHLSLSLPYLFFGGNLKAMAIGYNFGIFFLFLMSVPMMSILLRIYDFAPEKIKNINLGFLAIGFLIVAGLFLDLHLPVIDKTGFIIWKVNPVLGIINAVVIAFLPFIFGFSFWRNRPSNIGWVERIKLSLLSSGSFIFSLACVYFAAQNLLMVISAFVFVTLGVLFWIIAFFIPKQETAPVSPPKQRDGEPFDAA